ncbi:hypothetical protein L596_017994 [Steinernema carpocapsae]|uniref:Pyruvate phosphate dikinase AMP/ATP-binding domain-containing protein n=1 Tax=Steinernema carpocapsae TaxID=34508 RepID=A0A4U5N3K3_STECR|nr:hypothetical protein L596_017994 [Steinernema carpocapsae]
MQRRTARRCRCASLSTGKERFVKVNGWWGATWIPAHSFADLRPEENGTSMDQISLLESGRVYRRALQDNSFVQSGEFHCTHEDVELFLRGSKIRRFFKDALPKRSALFASYFPNGDRIFFRHVSHADPEFSLGVGHFYGANFETHRLHSIKAESFYDEDINEDIVYSTEIHRPGILAVGGGECVQFSFARSDGVRVSVRRLHFNHVAKNSNGYGTIINEEKVEEKGNERIEEDRPEVYEALAADRSRVTVPLCERACEDCSFTGGKGANLAKLKRFNKAYMVPDGFVVSVTAFEKHLEANPSLKVAIEKLDERQSAESLKESEERIFEEFEKTYVTQCLEDEVRIQLNRVFGNFDSLRFAVRSSAVGEDGADLSFSGQMESFLEVKGVPGIITSILSCWKSNFRREALSYRRQYGQLLNPPMAVVVQEMISDGVAGVLFTNHPVSGDPDKIVLNVIKGIGEDLVSGYVTPTEIVLDKRLNVLSMDNDNDVLTVKQVQRVAKVGLDLERFFGNPQDVEFVVKGEELYLVQSRDITNLDLETKWELLHEFDSPLISDTEVLTTANVGEVLPKALSPLSITATADIFDVPIRASIAAINGDSRIHTLIPTTVVVYRQRELMNLTDMCLRGWSSVEKDPVAEYNVAGTRIFTSEMLKIAKERYRAKTHVELIEQLIRGIKVMLVDSYRHLENAKKRVAGMPRAKLEMNVEELLDLAETQREFLVETMADHTLESVFSSFTYVFVASILRGSFEGDLTPETLSDIAAVYSVSKNAVISADVPASLEIIAKQICREKLTDKFLEIKDERESVEWLRSQKEKKTAKLIEEFFVNHGHRGLNELDLNGSCWKRNPEQLIRTLKAMLLKGERFPEEEELEDLESVIDNLHCKVTGFKRSLLRFFIQQAHRGVEFREAAKNLIVKATDELRETFLLVGEKLHEENRIPHARLIMFFTTSEIRELIVSRSATLVARAHRRERILPLQDEEEYSLMYVGHATPKTQKIDLPVGAKLEGTPVCQGVVTGRARVAKNLEEATDTQPGEILITRYTDIGWSPYFPLIKGLVTEIGGLLSHGSVVAREYGLPSLIAVENATNFFKTGDEVILDSKHGFVSRLTAKQ